MSLLHKKRDRKAEPLTITLGKLNDGYYYISDSLSGGTKIKIPLMESTSKKDHIKIDIEEENSEQKKNESSTILQKIIIDQSPEVVQPNNVNNQITPKRKESELIKIPESSKWFNMEEIHEIEKKSLPEFFSGKFPSKNPEIYKKYRNFIINLYRKNPSIYLTGTVCRRYLSGDVCAILRLHKFLEQWGLINFKLDPKYKPNNNFVPKSFNYKSPIYIDSSSFLIEKNDIFTNYTMGNNNIVLTNKGKELRTLYPINKISENIFKGFLYDFNNNNTNNQMMNNMNNNNNNLNNINNKIGVNKISRVNFLLKNYRPKCDLCEKLCSMDWYITKGNDFEELITEIKEQENNNNNSTNNNNNSNTNTNKDEEEKININNDIKKNNSNFIISISNNNIKKETPKNVKALLICEDCYLNSEKSLPEGLKKEDFEVSSIYNIFCKDHKIEGKITEKLEEEKWKEEETQKLLDALEKYKDSNWNEVINYVNNSDKNENDNESDTIKKTKEDCIMHLLQLPIKENYSFRIIPESQSQSLGDNISYNNGSWNNIPGLTDLNNPMTGMIDLFSIFFKKYLEEDYKIEKEKERENERDIILEESKKTKMDKLKKKIYEEYKNVDDRSNDNNEQKELNNDEDEKEIKKKIVETLLFTQMKTLELKMNYFNSFDKILNFKKSQLKSMENQIVQERIKIAIKNEQIKEQIENKKNEIVLDDENAFN